MAIVVIVDGEISLADKMAEIGKRSKAGQEVRLVDIPADAGAGQGAFEELHGAASSGHSRKSCAKRQSNTTARRSGDFSSC